MPNSIYTMDQPADTGSVQHGTITEPPQPEFQPIVTPRFNMAKGGSVSETRALLKEGGMMDEGGSVDPISGNEVPTGAMKEEVRDDIPAQLSEGEFVFPADVVRYIGLERLMMMRQAAKKGLMQMEDMGQMSNGEDGSEEEDTAEFESQIDEIIGVLGGREPGEKEDAEMAEGGMVAPPMQAPAASPMAPPAPAAMPPQSAPPAPPPEGVAPSAASEQTNAAMGSSPPTSEQPTERGNPEVDAIIAQSMEADQLTDAEKQAMAGFLQSEPAQLAITLRERDSLFLCIGLSKTELAVTVFTTDSPEILNESVGKFLGAVKTAKIKSLQGATKNPNLIAAFEANSIKPITTEENGIISYKVKVSEFKPKLG
jgi:hypothetical protein